MSTQHEEKIDLDQLEALMQEVENATSAVQECVAYESLYGWLSLRRLNSLIGLARKAQEPAVPEGWAIVPIDPTDEMIVAFAEEWYSRKQVIDDPDMVEAYKAMLAAAKESGNV